jgi:SpoVK/Ycf46/Vps4 family AAA+-type ATPase
VCNDVIDAGGAISWDDIAGLQTAKDLIREIVVWPMLNPTIFTVRSPGRAPALAGSVLRNFDQRNAHQQVA